MGKWFADAFHEIWIAVGVRRYAIGGIITGALAITGAIYTSIYHTGIERTVSYLIVAIIIVGFLFICVLNRAVELRRQTTPSVDTFLDEQHKGVEEFHTQTGSTAKYVQVSVRPITNAPLLNCQVRLRRVERIKADGSLESLLNESLTCIWSKTPVDTLGRAAIQTDDIVRANLFFVDSSDPNKIHQSLVGGDVKLFNGMQAAGDFRLTISASAEGISAPPRRFILRWGGSYASLSLEAI